MKTQPLVSVLMTVYNREKYIAEAIESVIASTYKNWELIIVDDQSKDKSVEIARKYENCDKRIKVYINDNNLGDYSNRNQAASYAKGEYLKYVDADDMIYNHTLEYLVQSLIQFPHADWATFSIKQNDYRPYPYVLNPEEQYLSHYIDKMGCFSRSPLSVIMKRNTFELNGGFSNRKMVGDFDMWHKLGLNHNLLVLPHSHGFVWYRRHDEQESNTINKFEGNYRKITMSYLNHSECPINDETKVYIKKELKKKLIRRIITLLAKLKWKQIKYV